ncbi:premnaspirodiene oxygenase-like [Phalaenopsis equestris]|uniref:premnaspirodiene oxygenase-like n=1 Tax=Phalaenopsis equestris TaxID=78828 RepID=UPI0009E4CB8D|nr:premnaspirodiene oxygenase-like [Phalaenopsis equestris]
MESLSLCQILPLILCIFLFFILKKIKSSKFSKTIKLPPGPTKLPIIGNIFQLLGDHPHRRLRDLANEYGPLLLLKLGEVNHIVVTSSEVASKVMKTHDINFASRPEFLATKILFYDSTSIGFSIYSKHWSQLRKICTVEVLNAKRVQSFNFLRKEEGENIVNKIRMARGSPVNLTEMFVFLTRTTVSRAVFGRDIAQKKNFLSAMRDASKYLIVDLFPSLKFISKFTGSKARLDRVHQQLDEILDEILEEHRARKFKRDDAVEDIVDVLFRLQNQGELDISLTNNTIKAVLLDLFLPGTITSSAALDWAMSELIKNPNILKKVQSEVRNAFNGKENMEESDISKLPYLNKVIKETFRLHPAGPLLLPRVCRNTIELEGYTIPVGSRILINAWAIMRDPKSWVDADIFRPERFEEVTFDFKGSNFEYIPFGGGMRSCPGSTFALAGIEYWLAQLLFHFDWELPGGMNPEKLDMEEHFGCAVSRKNDLLLVATPYK